MATALHDGSAVPEVDMPEENKMKVEVVYDDVNRQNHSPLSSRIEKFMKQKSNFLTKARKWAAVGVMAGNWPKPLSRIHNFRR